MNLKLKAILEGMARDGLRPDPLLDWDLLSRLAAACDDLMTPPPTESETALLHPAVRAGNAVLYRLTIGARWFLFERVSQWLAAEDPLFLAALSFVCAHAREPEVLWRCSSRAELIAEAAAWIRGVTATAEELDAALAEILGKPDAAPSTAAPPRKPISGATLERLAHEHGITPEDALWRKPEAEITVLAEGLAERKRTEAGGASDPDSPRIKRIVAVQQAEAALREAVRARRDGALRPAQAVKPLGERKPVDGQRPGADRDPRQNRGDEKQDAQAGAAQHGLQAAGQDEAQQHGGGVSKREDSGVVHETGRGIK